MFFSVEKNSSTTEAPEGVAGFISWRRMAEVLRSDGETDTAETLTHFKVTDRGLQYYVTRKCQP
jgi:hypothetical protein